MNERTCRIGLFIFLILNVILFSALNYRNQANRENEGAAYVQQALFLDDTASYVEGARFLKEGKGLVSYPYGVSDPKNSIQVPIKHFPPGYVFLISALMLVGLDTFTAAHLIPILCLLAIPFVIYSIYRHFFSPFISLLAAILFSSMARTILFAVHALSDVPFLLFTLLSLLVMFRAVKTSSLKGILLAGLLSGYAVLIRNVGYSLVGSIGLGLMLTWYFEKERRWRIFQMMLFYGFGVAAVYGPLLIYNFVIFGSFQPYSMPPSELTFIENIKFYLWALTTSFLSNDQFAKFFFIFNAFVVIKLFLIILRTWKKPSSQTSRLKTIFAFTTLAYLILGSFLVIYARSKYRWGEDINSRHLLQYNWIYLGCYTYVLLDAVQKSRPRFRIGLTLVFLTIFYAAQVHAFVGIAQRIPEKRSRMASLYNAYQKVTLEDSGSYFVSTSGPRMRVLTGHPVRQISTKSTPKELIDLITPQQGLMVFLEKKELIKYSQWQNIPDIIVSHEFEIKYEDNDIIVLNKPKRFSGGGN